MSDEKPKKRDRLLAYFGRAKSRTQIYTGSPSTTTVGSRIRDRKANLPPTSVLSAAGSSGEAIASSVPSGSSPVIQHSTKSLESTVGSPHAAETQDAATESNPTSNVVGTSASAIADNTVTAMDGIATVYYTVTTTDTTSITDDTVTTTDTTATADGTVTTKTAATADNTKARGPHLWSRAYRGNALSASERETLAGLAIETDTRDFASSLRNITEGIVDGNKGKHWKIRFKGDEIVMRDVGMKILRWVNRFKEIGDIIVQYDPGHSALPWAGFRFLLKLLLDKQETVDAILVGLEKTAYLIHRCAIYELLYFTEATRASKNLELSMLALYVAILKFLAKAIQRSKVEYSSSDKAFPANPSTDTRVEAVFTTGEIVEYFEDVTSLEETVERDAAVAEAQCTRAGFESLRTLLDDINILTSRLSPQIDGIQQRLEGSRRSDILEWISKIPYTNHHKRISEVRLKGTGEWLFKKTEYHNWRSSSASKLLLLRGIPGAGKTFIASRVIDSFLSSPNAEKLAYFYCNRAEENRRQPESILNTLIQQLAQTESDDDKLLMPLVCIYEAREKRGQKSSHLTLTESQELLVQLTDIYPQTTICIDALDEVENETRIQLLKSLKYVVETSKNRVKIFATTRMDIDILRQLEMFPRIDLQPDDNVGDINRFVETKVRGTIDDGLLLDGVVDRALNAEICDVLCERSKGMFQLAALQVTFLCDMTTRKDVINSLKVLPETLTAAYGEIYKRILSQKGSAPRLALNAFRWIQCSYEPLASETLLDAVTVELDSSGEFSHDKIQVNDVLKACQNLLILDEGLDVFRFAHLSVDEYFETQLLQADSHSEIARVCLSLLCTPGSWDEYDIEMDTKRTSYSERHLLLYAAVFWPWHFSRCDDGNCDILTGLWDTFLSGSHYHRWLDYHFGHVDTVAFTEDKFWYRSYALQQEGRDILSSVCVFGLARKFATVFDSSSVDSACIDSLLVRACTFGELDIVQLLLDVGANVLVRIRDLMTLLQLTLEGGHEAVALLLIDRGADVSPVNARGITPLQLAARGGHEAVVRRLLDRGAGVYTENGYKMTPLHLASQGGHEAVARLMLERGADLSTKNVNGMTPLHFASQWGRKAVAQLLVDRGADASISDADGMTPMHLASQEGQEALVRMLIDWGADVSPVNADGMMPLHLAAQRGHGAVAVLLLDQGADFSTPDEAGRTPLHLAWAAQHEAVVQLLVDRGANVLPVDDSLTTPLQLALQWNYEALALMLVDSGVDLSTTDRYGRTALHFASGGGHGLVAQKLIDMGADVAPVDARGRTPLHLASEEGHAVVVRLLVDRGAELFTTDAYGMMPVNLAWESRHEVVIHLLEAYAARYLHVALPAQPSPL